MIHHRHFFQGTCGGPCGPLPPNPAVSCRVDPVDPVDPADPADPVGVDPNLKSVDHTVDRIPFKTLSF